MTSSWQAETGHLVCRWSDMGQLAPYHPVWMQGTPNIQSSYLPPSLDFASHTPFGGAHWFQPDPADRDCE